MEKMFQNNAYSTQTKLKAISLFSGCGGFDLGAQQAGVKIIWANDINKSAATAYKSIHPDVEFVHKDIRKIQKFPTADILIGCYPCTGFSLAARRKWKTRGDRDLKESSGNFLFMEFLRVLNQIKPKYFFVENVRGMLTAEKGWFFKQQIEGFKECGYHVEYETLNSQDYGVAQSRQRVFIVGIRNDTREHFKYQFKQPSHGKNCKKPHKTLKDAIGKMPEWPEGDFFNGSYHGHYLTRNRKRSWDQASYTIVANAPHVPLHPLGEPMVFVKKDTWKLQGDLNRRLSWRECAVIQGFSKDTALNIESLTERYKVIGNAVPPKFGKILLEPVVKYELSL